MGDRPPLGAAFAIWARWGRLAGCGDGHRSGWYREEVFGPVLKGIGLAASPAGRRVIRHGVRLARSEEGRRIVAQAKKVAASPEARKLARQAAEAARNVRDAANTPENRHRVKAAAKAFRQRAGR